MKNTSYFERSAWVSLISTLVGFVPYFWYVLPRAVRGELSVGEVVGALVSAIIIQIIIIVIANVLNAFLSRSEKPFKKDERDISIELRSYKQAYIALTFGFFWVIFLVIPFGVVPFVGAGLLTQEIIPHLLTPAFLTQTLLLCFVAAEVVKHSIQIVGYRYS